jgi:hypothetical protein
LALTPLRTRFILRRPRNYQLLDEQEQLKKPGGIGKGKRSWDHRLVTPNISRSG